MLASNLMNFKELKQKYWSDPVWSKVISTVIIAVGGGILGLLWAVIKSLYQNIPFKTVVSQFWEVLSESTPINNALIVFVAACLLFSVVKFASRLYKVKKTSSPVEKDCEALPKIQEHSTVFFEYRLSDAFPGQRGLVWYTDPKTIVSRLSIALSDPLQFDRNEVPLDYVCDPVWWFRGHSSMFISTFKKLTSTKVLMDFDEMYIDKIAVNIDKHYYKCFIYVELKADKPSGVRKVDEEYINDHFKHFKYVREEAGYYKGKYYSREEYEDRATVRKGKVIPIPEMTLRVRYLSRYNFLIAAKQSPFNSTKFENESGKLFDNILSGNATLDDFMDTLDSYKKKQSFYE